MKDKEFKISAIGTIYSPFKNRKETPIQFSRSDAEGKVIVDPEFLPGLKDLEEFSHIILFYVFHASPDTKLQVKPFLDKEARGVFSCRHPDRPNHLGFSVVELLGIEDNMLRVKNIDILNETPLIDIKPYITEFDELRSSLDGWYSKRNELKQTPEQLGDEMR